MFLGPQRFAVGTDMKRFRFIPITVVVGILCTHYYAFGETEDAGIKFLGEGREIEQMARNDSDRERAIKKYQEAFRIFEKAKSGIGKSTTPGTIGMMYKDPDQYAKVLDYMKGIALSNIGHVYNSLGRYEKALENHQKHLTMSRLIGDTKGEGTALNNIGLVYCNVGQYDKALENYAQSLSLMRETGDLDDEGVTLCNMGLVYEKAGEFLKALEYYETALETVKETANVNSERSILSSMGLVHIQLGQHRKALECYKKLLEVSRRIGDVAHEMTDLSNIAELYNKLGQFNEALEYFEKSLEISRRISDTSSEGVTLNKIGLVCHHLGQFTKALDYHGKSLNIKKRIGDAEGEGVSLNNIGAVYNELGQYKRALEYHENSLKMRRKIGDLSGEGSSLNNIGLSYENLGQYTKALEYYEKALVIAKKIGDLKAEGTTLNNIGAAYRNLGQYTKALEYYEKFSIMSKNIGDVNGQGISLVNIGTVYLDIGEFPTALDYFQKYLAFTKQIGDIKLEGIALNNMATAYSSLGQYSKALEYYENDLAVTRATNDVNGEGTTLNNIGNVYRNLGKYSKAMEYFEKSLEIKKNTGDKNGEGVILNNVGLICRYLGQYTIALKHYQESISIMKSVGNLNVIGANLVNMADAYAQQLKYDNAIEIAKQALEIKKQIGVPTTGTIDLIANYYLDAGNIPMAEALIRETQSCLSLGRLALLKNDYPSAIMFYTKCALDGERTGDSDLLFSSYTGLGLAFEGQGDNSKSEYYFKKAVGLTEELRFSLKQSEKETFFQVKILGFHRTEPYEGLVRVCTRSGRALDALKWSEFTKARVFSEQISRRLSTSAFQIPREILERDMSLQDQLSALKQARDQSFKSGRQEALDAIGRQIDDIDIEFQEHVRGLRRNYPLFAASRYPQPMELAQTELKHDEWLIEYDVTDTGLAIFLVKGKELIKATFKPFPRSEIESLILKFRTPIEQTGEDISKKNLFKFDLVSSHQLADLLMSDILNDIPEGQPFIIVPDDCLGSIPFEMLAITDCGKVVSENGSIRISGANFLGDRNPLSYSQSVLALSLARTTIGQTVPGKRLLAFVDPIFSEDDERLKKIEVEKRQQLLKSLPVKAMNSIKMESGITFLRLQLTAQLGSFVKKSNPGITDLYEGLKANKKALKELDLLIYRSLLFATHGYLGNDLPGIQEPVLVFSLVDPPPDQDGFLRLTEIMDLKLNSEIIALTACNTGYGQHISGEGVMGLGRAFQYAGAKSVLMSLWNVAETSSVMLVESFFKHLNAGKNKLEALKLARNEIRQHGYDHPFYWAPFILVGEVDSN